MVFAIGMLMSVSFTAGNLIPRGGFYIAGLDFIYCTSQNICNHERAHQIDAHNGFISSSDAFHDAVYEYAQKNGGIWGITIANYHGGWSEMYAQIYESCGGNIMLIPEELRMFYEP